MKKLKQKNPKLDLKEQLTNNTLIFKENLKQIVMYLIDLVWKDKTNGKNILKTIEWATKIIYKGNFEEI